MFVYQYFEQCNFKAVKQEMYNHYMDIDTKRLKKAYRKIKKTDIGVSFFDCVLVKQLFHKSFPFYAVFGIMEGTEYALDEIEETK